MTTTMSDQVIPEETQTKPQRSKRTLSRKDTQFVVNARGQKLFQRIWHPTNEGPPKGIMFVCHGYGEHTDWYQDYCELMTSHGILCFAHDHLGHGLSAGDRATVPDIELYVDDVLLQVAKFKYLYRSIPCFIFGHSMGGMLALRAVQRNPRLFQGMILEDPLIQTVDNITFGTSVAIRLANMIYPNYEAVEFPLKYVSSDKNMLRKLESDPLRWNNGIKVSMLKSFQAGIKAVNRFLGQVSTPFLVLHAEHDKSCHVEGSKRLYRVASAKDKQIITFPEGEHHLFIEIPDIRWQAMRETVHWVKSRCG